MTQVIEKQRIDLGVLPTKGVDYWTEEDIAPIDAATQAANDAADSANAKAEEARKAAEYAHEAAGKVAANIAENTKKTEENIKDNTTKTDSAIEALANMKKDVDDAIALAKAEAEHADDSAVNADASAATANRTMEVFARAESTRNDNEEARIQAETARVTAETTRNANEETRKNQEDARQAGEANRTQAFNQSQVARQQTFEASETARNTEFERTQNEKQTIFDTKEAERDEAVRVATAITPRVEDIETDMGKYQQLPDVTLTIVESGKRIDKNGKFVADSNWNVGRLGAISKGNIYELFMGGSDKMVLGTALFVSHTIERIAGVDTDVYTPIYSAATSDLPISNYAVLLAGEGYADVLVSYRNDVSGANVMKVARWGIFASLATQYSNLKEAVDLKSFADGYYKNMRVGNADTLTIGSTAPTYDEQLGGRQVNNAPEMMGTRDASSTNSTSNISVREMRGGVVGGNQMVDSLTTSSPYITKEGSVYHVNIPSGTSATTITSIYNDFTMLKSHRYILVLGGKKDTSGKMIMYLGATPSNRIADFVANPSQDNITSSYRLRIELQRATDSEIRFDIIPSLLDLTHLFPTDTDFVNSLRESDAIKVANKLSFFAYDRTAANGVIHDTNATLAKMAEVIAKMGYVAPKLTFGSAGRINLVDGNTGRIKQSIDMITTKNKAWNKALAVLREKSIAIPSFLEKPSEFGVNDDVCVKWTNDHLEISAWGVEFDGTEAWSVEDRGSGYYNMFRIIKGSATTSSPIVIGYESSLTIKPNAATINSSNIQIVDTYTTVPQWRTHLASLKAAGTPLQVLYQLAEPIIIPFDEPLNLNLVDAKPYDLYILDDMDGEPMYEAEVTPNADGTYHTIVSPKAEWVDAHKQLPVTIGATLAGIGTNIGYDFIMNLEQRVRNLENR